jgi:hypothetical protein
MATAEIIINEQDARTVAVKACCVCSGQLLESDRFCRWCGEVQADGASGALYAANQPASHQLAVARYTTSLLVEKKSNLYHRVSGPLVNAVVKGVASGELGDQSRWARRAMLALISLPIWLMIVLLSPLDAYAAAKNLLRENQ